MEAGYEQYPGMPQSWWHLREKPGVALRLAIGTAVWFGSLVLVFTMLPALLR